MTAARRRPVLPIDQVHERDLMADLAVRARDDRALADEVRRTLFARLTLGKRLGVMLGFGWMGWMARNRDVRFEGEDILRELIARLLRAQAQAIADRMVRHG